MKSKINIPLLILLFGLLFNNSPLEMLAQNCSERNPAGCVCPNPTDTICSLLPDIVVSEEMLLEAEFNPEIPRELRISIATPNIGYGILEVEASDWFVCMGDTIKGLDAVPETCEDGSFPQRLIRQNVYSRSGFEMSKTPRWAGSMTYHPTHGHMHVDDWCAYSIRTKVEGQSPKEWPIVAEGRKIGFCLSDSEVCDALPDYCDESDSFQVPNKGFGEGRFRDCDFRIQGISVGFVDIYWYYLDDMDIAIPKGTCNGDYQLVVEADPFDNFLESNEDNNIVVVPITLSKQNPLPNELMKVQGKNTFCEGESVQINALIPGSYEWSTGATDSVIEVTESGAYWLKISNDCGVFYSDTTHITVNQSNFELSATDTLCQPSTVLLTIDSLQENQTIQWFDDLNATEAIATAPNYETDILQTTQTFYAQSTLIVTGETFFTPPHDNTFGSGGFNNPALNGGMIFDVLSPCNLQSIKVYAGGARERRIEVLNADSVVIYSKTFDVVAGENRLQMNLPLEAGTDYLLRAATDPTFYRNNANVSYPYTIDGLISIKGCTLDRPDDNKYFYYFFYDWEIKEPDYTCISEKKEITIVVDSCFTTTPTIPTVSASYFVFQDLATGHWGIQFEESPSLPVVMELLNLEGKVVKTASLREARTLFEGRNRNDLNAGIYILKLNYSGVVYWDKLYLP